MWLATEYEGHDETATIRLHSKLERERDKHINKFLADHRDDLGSGECPNCGWKQRGAALEECPDCGVRLDDERSIKEWAGGASTGACSAEPMPALGKSEGSSPELHLPRSQSSGRLP